MDTAIATLEDGLDHSVEAFATTLCGQPVPMGSPIVQTTTNPCPECFPDLAKPKGKSKKSDGDSPAVA